MHDHSTLRVIGLACVAGLLALDPTGAAADGPSQVVAAPNQARPVLEKQGRRSTVTAKPGEDTLLKSADAVVSVRVRPRSLAKATTLSIQQVTGHTDRGLRSPTYELGPATRRFPAPMQLCFAVDANARGRENLCLGYYDEASNRWKCEDTCLVPEKTSDDRTILLCGNTDHFTNYAILRAPADDDQSKCAATEEDLPFPIDWGGTGSGSSKPD